MGRYVLGGLSTVPASERPRPGGPVHLDGAGRGRAPRIRWASSRSTRRCRTRRPPSGSSSCPPTAWPTAWWSPASVRGEERFAACVVLATTRADVNGLVKRHLDVRKASFLPMDRAVGLTGMEYGGITPIGLPAEWPVLIDRPVVEMEIVVLGSGVRRSKILLPGPLLTGLRGALLLDGLGLPIPPGWP